MSSLRSNGWAVTTFGEAFDFLKTGSHARAAFSPHAPVGCVHYGDIHQRFGRFLRADREPLPGLTEAQAAGLTPLRDGDLLIADASEDYEGVGASVELANLNGRAVVGGLHTLGLRRKRDDFVPGFIGHLTAVPSVRAQLVRAATGLSVYGVSKMSLAAVEIPKPGPNEQRAIAGALADAGGLADALDAVIAKRRAVRTAALGDLLTGRTRLPGFGGEWQARRLGTVGGTYGGLTGKTKRDFGRGAASYVTFLNVVTNPVVDFEKLARVNVAAGERQNAVARGDLLFNGSSETPEEVGLCSAVLDDLGGAFLNSFCIGFRPQVRDILHPRFAAYLFRSTVGRSLMAALAQGATRYNLSKAALLNVEPVLPDFEEQTSIAEVLADMDAELDALRARRDKAARLADALAADLLAGRRRLV